MTAFRSKRVAERLGFTYEGRHCVQWSSRLVQHRRRRVADPAATRYSPGSTREFRLRRHRSAWPDRTAKSPLMSGTGLLPWRRPASTSSPARHLFAAWPGMLSPEKPEAVAVVRDLMERLPARFKDWVRLRRGPRLKGAGETLFNGSMPTRGTTSDLLSPAPPGSAGARSGPKEPQRKQRLLR